MVQRISGEDNGPPLQYSCLENPMGGVAWWAIVHGVAQSWTWRSNFIFTFHLHALEKEMATHSSVLAWRIRGMGEPGGLRVRHDWIDLAAAAAEDKNLPANAGDIGLIPGLGRASSSTCCGATKPMHHNYWAHVLEPKSSNYWAWVLQLLNTGHLEPVLHSEKPLQWEAHVSRQRVVPTCCN